MSSSRPAPSSGVRRERRGAVEVLTLDRPERRNSLDLEDREALLSALLDVRDDPTCRALVLTGADGFFSAGGDIASMTTDPVVGARRLELVEQITRALVAGPTPAVAAVEGGAYGLGLGLALACDVVVAGRSVRCAAAFARIGLVTDTGLSYSLPGRIGPGRARALLLTARTVDADEALATGMVDELVDDGATLDRALEVAERLAAFSAPATAQLKALLAQPDQSLDALLAAETRAQQLLWRGEDFAEGQQAFLERRTPTFREA